MFWVCSSQLTVDVVIICFICTLHGFVSRQRRCFLSAYWSARQHRPHLSPIQPDIVWELVLPWTLSRQHAEREHAALADLRLDHSVWLVEMTPRLHAAPFSFPLYYTSVCIGVCVYADSHSSCNRSRSCPVSKPPHRVPCASWWRST